MVTVDANKTLEYGLWSHHSIRKGFASTEHARSSCPIFAFILSISSKFWVTIQSITKPMHSNLTRQKREVEEINWGTLTHDKAHFCRVWPILTRSWGRQQSRTSGADALKPYKNRSVRHYHGYHCTNMKTSKTMGCPGALPQAFKNFLGRATAMPCMLG